LITPFKGDGRDTVLDAVIVRLLARGRSFVEPSISRQPLSEGDLAALLAELQCLPAESHRVTDIPLPELPDLHDGLRCVAFPDFGLFILRGARLFLSLRCAGHERADAPSGHTHDDNLAMELQIGGREVIVDPGSYLYTAFPEIRERYRAAGAHFVPRPTGCSAAVPGDLFELRHVARATCLHCGPDGIAGRLDAPDWRAWRVIEFLPGILRVTDACAPGQLAPIPIDPPATSNGYGKLTANPAYSF